FVPHMEEEIPKDDPRKNIRIPRKRRKKNGKYNRQKSEDANRFGPVAKMAVAKARSGGQGILIPLVHPFQKRHQSRTRCLSCSHLSILPSTSFRRVLYFSRERRTIISRRFREVISGGSDLAR